MNARTPALTQAGQHLADAARIAVSKDVWMLGIGSGSSLPQPNEGGRASRTRKL
jgi:hypothetical protein